MPFENSHMGVGRQLSALATTQNLNDDELAGLWTYQASGL